MEPCSSLHTTERVGDPLSAVTALSSPAAHDAASSRPVSRIEPGDAARTVAASLPRSHRLSMRRMRRPGIVPMLMNWRRPTPEARRQAAGSRPPRRTGAPARQRPEIVAEAVTCGRDQGMG